MIKIDELPVEILMKIFTYLPRYSEVALVNKVFYDVACSVNDLNNYVDLHDIFMVSKVLLKCVNCFKMIKNSTELWIS